MPSHNSKIPASQKKAVSKYIRQNYEAFTIRSRLGFKEEVKNHAAIAGESINQYVLNAVKARIDSDLTENRIWKNLDISNPKERHTYHIMHENDPVADVSITNDHKEIIYSIWMPAGCNQPFCAGRLDLMRFYRFLKDRCYEDTRGDLPEILREAGLTSNDPWKWVRITHGVSWHDHIWIKFDDEDLKWEDVRIDE